MLNMICYFPGHQYGFSYRDNRKELSKMRKKFIGESNGKFR